MKIRELVPPRFFYTSGKAGVRIADCAHIQLASEEMVTFITERDVEYDVVRKKWGFYATPSINRRLARFGLRPVLARNSNGDTFLLLVERDREADFIAYLSAEFMTILAWLDDPALLEKFQRNDL